MNTEKKAALQTVIMRKRQRSLVNFWLDICSSIEKNGNLTFSNQDEQIR